MGLNQEIGCRLKALRERKGETQKEISNVLNVTPAAYGKIEAGDRGLSSEYCIQLADYFGVTCDYILRGISSENIDICERTDLDQVTIELLEKYKEVASLKTTEEEMRQAIITRHVINALLQSDEFISTLVYEIDNCCISLNEALNYHYESADEASESIPSDASIQTYKARNAINACRFSASQAFNDLFLYLCSDTKIIDEFLHLSDRQKKFLHLIFDMLYSRV